MIKYLSPSSLALFRAQPALWVGKYLLGWRDEAGPAAWRGSAVEAGLDLHLFKIADASTAGLDQHLAKALDRFELDAQGDMDEKVCKQRDLIKPLLQQAIMACDQLPMPVGRQFKVEYRGAGLEWPMVGYLDYLFEDHLFDLKTTERMPSEPRTDHLMQQAIYSAGTERPAKLLYVTPKKYQWFDIGAEQQQAALADAISLGRNIESLLRLSTDPHKLLRCLPCNFDDFHWSDGLRQMATEALAA